MPPVCPGYVTILDSVTEIEKKSHPLYLHEGRHKYGKAMEKEA